MDSFLQDKRGLILGVSNRRSLGWQVATAAGRLGARLMLTYQNERFARRVEPLVDETEDLGEVHLAACDATCYDEVDDLFASVEEKLGGLDFLVHCWAFAPQGALDGDFVDTSWEDYRLAQQISSHSLTEVARRARPLMDEGAAVLTLTYYGSQKVMPGYNAMGVAKASLEATVRYLAYDLGPEGIRVNALSAGPVNTLSARGVPDFLQMLKEHEQRSPLRRNVQPEEIGNAAVFLISPWASAITGQVIYADAGYKIMG